MASNSAKQIGVSESSEELTSCLYLVAPIEAWTGEAYELIRSAFPEMEIIDLDSKSDLSSVAEKGVSVLILEAKNKSQVDVSLRITQRLSSKIRKKDLTVVFLAQAGNYEVLTQLELSGVVQVLSPSISAKALKIKIDLLFSKMKEAKKGMKPVEDKDYIFRAEEKAKKPDNVINISPQKTLGSDALIKNESTHREWGKGPAQVQDGGPKVRAVEKASTRSIVLVSSRTQDLELAGEIAVLTKSNFHHYHPADCDLVNFLSQHPESVVFWDIDNDQASGNAFSSLIPSNQIFVILDKNISRTPPTVNDQGRAFGHRLLRGKSTGALEVYAKMVDRVMCQAPFNTDQYFGAKSQSQVYTISQASHRTTAVLGAERFLIRCGLLPRIAVQAARAADELILNAIEDAPVDSRGHHYRHGLTQPPDYQFNQQEKIILSVFKNDDYYAIFVQDRFGSLDPAALLDHLQKSGLGLNSVVEMGFSLHAVIQPGEMTAVSIFFPNVKSYVSFRKAFRFFSVTSLKKNQA